MSLEEGFRAVVREEMRRVLREELRTVLEEIRLGPSDGQSEFLSIKESAELAKVSEVTVREWLMRGLKRYGQGRVVRVRRADLLAFLSTNREEAEEQLDVEEHAVAILGRARGR